MKEEKILRRVNEETYKIDRRRLDLGDSSDEAERGEKLYSDHLEGKTPRCCKDDPRFGKFIFRDARGDEQYVFVDLDDVNFECNVTI